MDSINNIVIHWEKRQLLLQKDTLESGAINNSSVHCTITIYFSINSNTLQNNVNIIRRKNGFPVSKVNY